MSSVKVFRKASCHSVFLHGVYHLGMRIRFAVFLKCQQFHNRVIKQLWTLHFLEHKRSNIMSLETFLFLLFCPFVLSFFLFVLTIFFTFLLLLFLSYQTFNQAFIKLLDCLLKSYVTVTDSEVISRDLNSCPLSHWYLRPIGPLSQRLFLLNTFYRYWFRLTKNHQRVLLVLNVPVL